MAERKLVLYYMVIKKLPSTGVKGSLFVELQFYNVLSLWSTSALSYVELNALAFVQRLEAFASDCGEVYEYVASAFNLDKTETFVCVEPFYCTCLHDITSKVYLTHVLLFLRIVRTNKNSHIGKGFIHKC